MKIHHLKLGDKIKEPRTAKEAEKLVEQYFTENKQDIKEFIDYFMGIKTNLTKEDLDATELAIRTIKNEYSKEYYKNNKDKIKARRDKFYAKNKERLQEIARKKYAEMSNEVKHNYNERYKTYYWKNKEKIAAKAREKYYTKKGKNYE